MNTIEPCPPLSLTTQYKFWAWVHKQHYKEYKEQKVIKKK